MEYIINLGSLIAQNQSLFILLLIIIGFIIIEGIFIFISRNKTLKYDEKGWAFTIKNKSKSFVYACLFLLLLGGLITFLPIVVGLIGFGGMVFLYILLNKFIVKNITKKETKKEFEKRKQEKKRKIKKRIELRKKILNNGENTKYFYYIYEDGDKEKIRISRIRKFEVDEWDVSGWDSYDNIDTYTFNNEKNFKPYKGK